MKCQVLFSLKNNKVNSRMSSATGLVNALRLKIKCLQTAKVSIDNVQAQAILEFNNFVFCIIRIFSSCLNCICTPSIL